MRVSPFERFAAEFLPELHPAGDISILHAGGVGELVIEEVLRDGTEGQAGQLRHSSVTGGGGGTGGSRPGSRFEGK